ncbi:GD13547 [Drosophila simulans]|uniref:GD13547 n=1 Tax=Drosophila simulans TaxID=7240 RepID=B4QKT1_DROSI|nr:GD13547 [Drosophila simulans]
MECQSENRVPENSISNVATDHTLSILPESQTSSVLAKHQQRQLSQPQQPPQYVINSVAMHAKATTANSITGGTLHRAKSAQDDRAGWTSSRDEAKVRDLATAAGCLIPVESKGRQGVVASVRRVIHQTLHDVKQICVPALDVLVRCQS